MNKLISLLFFVIIVAGASAQKLNTKDFDVQAQYTQLPAKGLDPTISTYEVKVDGNESDLRYYGTSLQTIKDRISLAGYQRIGGGASLVVLASVGTPSASQPVLVTEEKTENEVKYKLYSYKHDIGVTSTYRLTTKDGRLIEDKTVTDSDVLKTKSFRTMDELKNHYANSYPKAKTDALQNLLSRNVDNISNVLNYDYGLVPKTAKVSFESLNSKDHPDMAKFDKMKTTASTAFSKMTASDNSAFLESIQPVVDFWIEQEKKYDPNNKDERKFNYAMRQNLANVYVWMEDFEKARSYMNKIEQGEVSANSGKRMKEELATLEAGMKRLNRPSIHITMQMTEEEKAIMAKYEKSRDSLYAAGDVRAFDGFDSKLGVKSNSLVDPATIYYKGGKNETGYLVYESNYKVPDFRQPSYIRFAKANGREIVATTLMYDMIDSMKIGKNSFHVKDVTIGVGMFNLKMENAIIEAIKHYQRSTLVIIHPPMMESKGLMGGGEEMEPELAYFHKGKGQYLVPEGLTGFRKPMANSLEDCAASVSFLMEKKQAPALGDPRVKRFLEADDMAEALRLYDTCK